MAYAHEPLPPDLLGPAVVKVVAPDAPAPMRAMVARGLAPLGPRDLLVALYQLWVTNDPKLGEEAGKTVEGLPLAILTGALADAHLPAGVLDFLGRKLPRNADVLERVVRHPNVHDETLVGVARVCPESVCDILAENQRRWMACPTIVESLYQNPNCRMSVVHRMLELAVRQGIDVKLPNMDQIRQALGDDAAPDPARDAVFRQAAGREVAESHERLVDRVQRSGVSEDLPDVPEDERDATADFEALLAQPVPDDLSLPLEADDAASEQRADEPSREPERVGTDRLTLITRLRPMEKIRLALLGSAFERSILIRDSNKAVALSAIHSPRVRENEVVAYAANRTLNHDVVAYIARRRDWTKLYAVKLNLVLNPKTPMSAAISFLGHLHAHDVRKVAHSKNIPSALAQAAKRKIDQRR